MEFKGKYTSKVLHTIFALMLLAVLVFFVAGELFMPKEDPTGSGKCALYAGEWERVLADGTREQVKVPGQCKAARGEVVRIETALSESQEDVWYCVRASQQDMQVYIGDELIKEYTTKDSRLFVITVPVHLYFLR